MPNAYQVDDEYAAGFLVLDEATDRTPYRFLRAVPPGAFVLANADQLEVRRFSEMDPGREIRYRSDSAYEEHFLHLFRESVRCRLRSEHVVMAELSGGLDSSSIICVADILRAEQPSLPPVESVSYIYDESPGCDEREFVGEIERQRRQVGNHLPDHAILSAFPGEDSVYLPNPMQCFPENMCGLKTLLDTRNARVLLSGTGGDNIMLGPTPIMPWFADLAVQGRFLTLARGLASCSKAYKASYAHLVRTSVVLPLLPTAMQLRLVPEHLCVPPWLDGEFVRRTHCRERLLSDPLCKIFPSRSRRMQFKWLLKAISHVGQGYYRERTSVEVAYPFLHKPLVDFAFAIPIEQLVTPTQQRSLHRRAMRGILPDKVRNRADKMGPDEAVYRAGARQSTRLAKLFKDAHVCAHGYVKPEELQIALKHLQRGLPLALASFLRTISLEIWLRAVDHGRPNGHTAVFESLHTVAC